MAELRRTPRAAHARRAIACTVVGMALAPGAARAQDAAPPADPARAPDSAAPAEVAAAPELPVVFTLGLGYGQRSDPCAFCASPDNTDSFTGHLGLGKKLAHGLAVGVDASVWRRGHPGPPGVPDSTGAATATSLTNMLGNASLTFSWQIWRMWVRAGGGVAYGMQDIEGVDGEGDAAVSRASGIGIGYSAGAGLALPLAGPTSIAFFANWNVGSYDLATPTEVLERDAKHEYLELGFGVTLR